MKKPVGLVKAAGKKKGEKHEFAFLHSFMVRRKTATRDDIVCYFSLQKQTHILSICN